MGNLFVWVDRDKQWIATDEVGTPLKTQDYLRFGRLSPLIMVAIQGDVAPDWKPGCAKGEPRKFVYERTATFTVRQETTSPIPPGNEEGYFELCEDDLESEPTWGEVVLISSSGVGLPYLCGYCREWATHEDQIEHYCPTCMQKQWVPNL